MIDAGNDTQFTPPTVTLTGNPSYCKGGEVASDSRRVVEL